MSACIAILEYALCTPFLSLQEFLKNCVLPNSHIHHISDVVTSLSEASSQKAEQEVISCQFANWRSVWKGGENCSDYSFILVHFLPFFLLYWSSAWQASECKCQISFSHKTRESALHISLDSIFINHITMIPLWAILFRHLESYTKKSLL